MKSRITRIQRLHDEWREQNNLLDDITIHYTDSEYCNRKISDYNNAIGHIENQIEDITK